METNTGWRKRMYIKIYCHYEERSDEVIQNYTCIFWIATKIFDFLAMTIIYIFDYSHLVKQWQDGYCLRAYNI